MKIHEYQGKELFRQAGVPVLEGIVATTPEEAVAAYEKLGGAIAVVKSQIHAGGRGKARYWTIQTKKAWWFARAVTRLKPSPQVYSERHWSQFRRPRGKNRQ